MIAAALGGWLACVAPDGADDGSVSELERNAGTAPTLDERDTIVVGLVGPERFDAAGTRKVFVRRTAGWFTELVVAEAPSPDGPWTEEVRIGGSPCPDRPAISPDGETIAFVTGVSGIASVWVMPFEGGANPAQLTNLGLEGQKREPGSPPAGFVPPPIEPDGLVFAGDNLDWVGPSGPVSVRWR